MGLNLYFLSVLILFSSTVCHLPDYETTPSDRIDQHCILAEKCIHDTIPVCGVLENKERTFLDHCDMLEYACDTGQLYLHVEDKKNCPEIKPTSTMQ